MRSAIIKARVFDNVLELNSDVELIITSRVADATLLSGTYNANNLISKSIKELADWTQSEYNLLYDPFLEEYRDNWTTEEIMDILEF